MGQVGGMGRAEGGSCINHNITSKCFLHAGNGTEQVHVREFYVKSSRDSAEIGMLVHEPPNFS